MTFAFVRLVEFRHFSTFADSPRSFTFAASRSIDIPFARCLFANTLSVDTGGPLASTATALMLTAGPVFRADDGGASACEDGNANGGADALSRDGDTADAVSSIATDDADGGE